MVNRRSWVHYFLFAAVACALFLYLGFPAGTLLRYVKASVRQFNPALVLQAGNARPVFPWGLRLEQMDLGFQDRPGISIFKADAFVVSPSLRTLTSRAPIIRFECLAYGGTIQGIVKANRFIFAGPFQSDIEMEEVSMGQCMALKDLLGRELEGILGGKVSCRLDPRGALYGSGNGVFTISKGNVTLAQPLFGIENIQLDRVLIQMLFENQVIQVRQFDFEGQPFSGKISGTIRLDPLLGKSRLNLTTNLESRPGAVKDIGVPTQALGSGNLTVSIRGTLAQPTVTLNR